MLEKLLRQADTTSKLAMPKGSSPLSGTEDSLGTVGINR